MLYSARLDALVMKLIQPASAGVLELSSDDKKILFHDDGAWKMALRRASDLGFRFAFVLAISKRVPVADVPTSVLTQIEVILSQERFRRIQLDRHLEECLKVLEESNIKVMVVHEMDLAKRFYADPLMRPVDHLDLLIPQEIFLKGLRVLGKAGYRLTEKHFKATQTAAELHRSGTGVKLRVHCTLPSRTGIGREAEVWDRSVFVRYSGVNRKVRVLSPEDSLISLVIRRALNQLEPSLVWLSDLSAILQRGIQTNMFENLLAQQGATTAAWFALKMTQSWDSSIGNELIQSLSLRVSPLRGRVIGPRAVLSYWMSTSTTQTSPFRSPRMGWLKWLIQDKPTQVDVGIRPDQNIRIAS